MASISLNQMNLQTLQKVDSNVVEIIDNACQVAIYKYEKKLEKWEGTDIEGALFLYRRALYPYYGFIIVNRMSTTNFMELLTSDMQIQLQEPYLMYQNHSGDIIGSWFYKQEDLQRISKKIQTIILTHTSPPKRQRSASESDTQPHIVETQSQDIMTLLTEAHEEYIKKTNSDKPSQNCEDVNCLSTYIEKETFQKSVGSPEIKKDNAEVTLRKYSSEECDPISPRRRFISTGSFDPDRMRYLSRMLAIDKLDANLDQNKNRDITKKLMQNELTSNVSNTSSHLVVSPSSEQVSLFLNDFNASSVDPWSAPGSNVVLDSQLQDFHTNKEDFDFQSSTQKNLPLKNAINGDLLTHFHSIKNAVQTHIEGNPKVMLKIHEAYVSSIKSLFTNSSC